MVEIEFLHEINQLKKIIKLQATEIMKYEILVQSLKNKISEFQQNNQKSDSNVSYNEFIENDKIKNPSAHISSEKINTDDSILKWKKNEEKLKFHSDLLDREILISKSKFDLSKYRFDPNSEFYKFEISLPEFPEYEYSLSSSFGNEKKIILYDLLYRFDCRT
jgi:hypothetical protein